jgi:lipopolysaccharide export LptBFGC system permease protein LptF
LEKEEIKNLYEQKVLGLQNIIENLNKKINKGNKNKINKEDKFINNIKVYKEFDNKSKEYVCSYTFRQISDYNVLRNFIIKDYKKEDYNEIIDYILKHISNKKSKWYFSKIKRCLYLFDTYKDKLKILNFSISFISNLSENDWLKWINLLDYIIKNIDENVKKCGNFGYGCNENVNSRTYCQECMEDGYYTGDSESDTDID